MNVTILAAAGGTGHELTRQALQRGHAVTAIARDIDRIRVPRSAQLRRVAADVHDVKSIEESIGHDSVVLSGLGVTRGDRSGTLTVGARAVIARAPARIIWLGAFGTGTSAAAASVGTRALLKVIMGSELADKVAADAAVLRAGGTIFHPGPLTHGPLSSTRRTVGLQAVPRRPVPGPVSRATVAAAMLDELECPAFAGLTAVPLRR